eukprot:PhF_6_TR35790/c0_g1_i1/m.52018/K11855/USP36_42; ubiquitin carboxyl-terminal hydrolase 36/42
MGRIFGGWTRSRVEWAPQKSVPTAGMSEMFEPFLVLSLELPKAAVTLEQCYAHHTAKETLSGENAYKIPSGQYVTATKQLLVCEEPTLPRILIIHLKRFRLGSKINRAVSFPEVFVLPNTTARYILYAVNVHSGMSMICGHYFSFCKADVGVDVWYRCDDSDVRVVPKEQVLRQQAYILFYQREGITSPEGAVMSPTKVKEPNRNKKNTEESNNKRAANDERVPVEVVKRILPESERQESDEIHHPPVRRKVEIKKSETKENNKIPSSQGRMVKEIPLSHVPTEAPFGQLPHGSAHDVEIDMERRRKKKKGREARKRQRLEEQAKYNQNVFQQKAMMFFSKKKSY